MHDYDVHEALYQNCEIHDPCVRGSGSRVGPIWPYSKHVISPKKCLYSYVLHGFLLYYLITCIKYSSLPLDH